MPYLSLFIQSLTWFICILKRTYTRQCNYTVTVKAGTFVYDIVIGANAV